MATSNAQPEVIGRYQVIRCLGVGGMGAVYLGRDPDLDRSLAIKLVKEDLGEEPELRERFLREARAVAKLRHPNIVTVFDIGEWQSRPFIAMEFLEGLAISEIIRTGVTVPVEWALFWVEQLCHGLAHAHRAAIIHRDIKPANLMVDRDGSLKIVDFGIARAGESQLTKSGMLVGTASYIAPEQLVGSTIDHRVDIFAVGLVFYELLTGQKAFPGTVADGLFKRICYDAPPAIASLRPNVEPEIAAIVDVAIAKDPQRRYTDLTAMATALARIRPRYPVSGPPPSFSADASAMTMAPTPAAGVARSGAPPPATPQPSGSSGASAGGSSDTSARIKVDSPSERRRWAEIMCDSAEMAIKERDFAQARHLLDDATNYDPTLKEVAELRAQIDAQEQAIKDAERRHAEAEASLEEASVCLARGDFVAARDAVRRAVAAEPQNFRAQSMVDRVRIAEASTSSRAAVTAAAQHAERAGIPWLRIVVIVSALVSVAAIAYLATR